MHEDEMAPPPSVALRGLTFTHDSAAAPLFNDLSVHMPTGFTGVVGANGAGKTTLLRLVTGSLQPVSGSIEGVADAVYCDQRTDEPPDALADFLQDWDGAAFELRGRLGIEPDWLERWSSLSHGERKRAQIGSALWLAPPVLAIDEPTNHIDSHARDLLLAALQRYRGVGLIVSHDRDLLDALCQQCLWLEPPGAKLFPGGYGKASEQRRSDRQSAVRARDKLVREDKQLQREISQRRARASREHQVRSKRGLSSKDSDAREKIDRRRVSDGKAGSPLRQLDGRAEQTRARLAEAVVDKVYETGIWLPGSRSRRDLLFDIEPGGISLGARRVLRHPALRMRPDERIAITGVNGAGKSTLLRHIVARLPLTDDKVVNMPQEVSARMAQQLLEDVRALPKDHLGHIMNVVSRLGSRPGRLLESRLPSPGEVRKLLLALGMSRAPHLIVMDEPTNHLDLPSIEALQTALQDCPCGLLLVSHDARFLRGVGAARWRIELDAAGDSVLSID